MSKDSETHWYLENESKPSLRMWVFSQMAMGAIYGMLVFFGAVLFIFALIAISNLLPEDPFATLDTGRAALTRLI